MAPNSASSDDTTLIALACTLAVSYLATRYQFLRWLWRYLPLLVVISAWLLNRKHETQEQEGEIEDRVSTKDEC